MSQLINKSDFTGIVKMSVNIPDSQVNIYCNEAQVRQLKPKLPESLYNALQTTMGAELQAFFDDYVKPYLVCEAFASMLLWQGKNVTQFGLVVNREDTSEQVSDKQRGELIASVEHNSNMYLAQMTKAMKDANYTFDSVSYAYAACAEKPKVKPKFFAV